MGQSLSLEDRIQNEVRNIKRHGRKMDREIMRIEREKNLLEKRIRKYATNGDIQMVKACSKEYVVFKKNIQSLSTMKCVMTNVQQKITMMKSVNDINNAILSMTNTLKVMNNTIGLSNINKIIMEFEQENGNAEVMGEMVEDVMGGDMDDEEEEEEIVSSVLDEIGITLMGSIQSAPTSNVLSNDTSIRNLEERIMKLPKY